MPAWGLTERQRVIENGMGPWGLHPALLAPAKVTTDPVHGDIYTTWIEQAIIDSPSFQRLRRIRQLGTTHLVYPGATHTRFSHSLGTLRVTQNLLDAALTQHEGRHRVPDLVAQWSESERERHITRSTVLARLGGLLHDLGHVPFGHSIEDDLKVVVEHDVNENRFDALWGALADFVRDRVKTDPRLSAGREDALTSLETLLDKNGDLHKELRPMIVSKGPRTKKHDTMEYPFVADLVGNTICADLLDYLRRDHLFTGLPFALGSRFMSAFFTVPEGRGEFQRRLALNIMRNGHERTDVVTEILKALRYRYELSERVLAHHAKLSADAMLGKALELWADALWLAAASTGIAELEHAEQLIDRGDPHAIRIAFNEQHEDEYHEDEELPNSTRPRPKIHAVDLEVRERLENVLATAGDDDLVAHLENFTEDDESSLTDVINSELRELVVERHRQAGRLARAFSSRELFKVAARVGIKDAPAKELYDRFGEARQRAEIERQAERFAGLSGDPQVLIWLPDPAMRVKVAQVLVDDGRHIDKFADYEAVRSRRGSDIYGGHSRLWSLWVFTHPAMPGAQQEEVLAYLAERFGVPWERRRDDWGPSYWTWVDQLILARTLDKTPNDPEVVQLARDVAQAAAARGASQTFQDRQGIVKRMSLVKEVRDRRSSGI